MHVCMHLSQVPIALSSKEKDMVEVVRISFLELVHPTLGFEDHQAKY